MISVLMSVHNGKNYVQNAIKSILNQTIQDFEFIIVNDCSTDDTENIILAFNDHRIKYIKNPENLGLTKSLNKGLALCNGKYIARMDHDDIAHAERLKLQFDFMQSNPEIDILGTYARVIGKASFIQPPQTDQGCKARLLFNSCFVHPTMFIRRKVFDSVQYDESFSVAQDYKLWTDAALAGFRLSNLPVTLLDYRIHQKQVTEKKKKLQQEARKEIIKNYWAYSFPNTNIESEYFVNYFLNGRLDYQYSKPFFTELIQLNQTHGNFESEYFTNELNIVREQVFLVNFFKRKLNIFTIFQDKYFYKLIKDKVLQLIQIKS